MKNKIKTTVFSFTGISIFVGVAGFLSALVTMFVDISSIVSIKWLLLLVLIFSTVVVILLKIIFDLIQQETSQNYFEKPIRHIKDTQGNEILVIRWNKLFTNIIVVGCYLDVEGIEQLAYIGVVHLVQDKVIQIRITKKIVPDDSFSLNNLEIKPVIPVGVFDSLSEEGI